jgi:hypothetical protein
MYRPEAVIAQSLVGQGEDAESGLLLLKGIATTFGIHLW